MSASPDSYPRIPVAPAGAPNVLIVLTDDVGFGACSTFGGPIPTPVLDRLAGLGLRYSAFHTTAMCSPTRAALLTGRNHHAVNSGCIVESARGDAGYTSVIPDSAATIAHTLSAHGYSTAFVGKHHNTPAWEASMLGPFERWPNGLGFDYFYGFLGAGANQFAPVLTENRNSVHPAQGRNDYFLDTDLADKAIQWLSDQQAIAPTRPFLLYVAPATAHSPHQAPREWIERFAGRFDAGWDAVRTQTFDRQLREGLLPEGTELTPRPEQIPAWSALSEDERRLAARMMEVYAAMLSHWDFQFGRVLDHLEQTGQLDNTLVLFIQGDNGASGEGGLRGSSNDIANLNGVPPTTKAMLADIDKLGGPESFGNYPTGWAWAMNAPFQWHKQVASHFGGTRNGLVVSWPRRIAARGEIRHDFHHVVDIAPTLYELVGIEPLAERHGVVQQPLHGQSMAPSFARTAGAPVRREQYFELLGHRAYVKDGWMACTTPTYMSWEAPPEGLDPEAAPWELYHLDTDFSQARNLAAQHPGKLAELQADFDAAARRFNVYPLGLDYRKAMTGVRPTVLGDRSLFVYRNTATAFPRVAFADVRNKSWRVVAALRTGACANSGAIVSQGSWTGGWGLYLREGCPVVIYKTSGEPEDLLWLQAPQALDAGQHAVEFRFDYGGGFGGGYRGSLWVDGRKVAEDSRPRSISTVIVGVAGIGRHFGSPLSEAFSAPCVFDGEIDTVGIEYITT